MLYSYYNGDVIAAVKHLFPEIRFSEGNVNTTTDSAKYREYLELYAKVHKFDPLIPDNWYPITNKQIREFKVCSEHTKEKLTIRFQSLRPVLESYDGNHIEALVKIFPEIGLRRKKFNPSNVLPFIMFDF